MKENTIIVPIIRSDFIGRMLETLARHTPDNYHVIVIDQTGNSEAYNAHHKKVALWITSYRNMGFSKAMNTGIRLADTPYITLANDDIEFMDRRWWSGIMRTFDKDKSIVAVNPMSPKEATWGYGLTVENHATWQPKPEYVVSDETKKGMVPVIDGKPFHYKEEFTPEDYDALMERHPVWQGESMIDAIAMWCTVFKKDALVNELGLLEERFYPGGGEDYDMNARAYSCAYPEERADCDPTKHRRMVASSLSWVWHHWGKSRDQFQTATKSDLFASREPWNNNDALWTPSFDVWGHYTDKDGVKRPIRRTSGVGIDEL